MELTLKLILTSDEHGVRDNRFYNIDNKYLLCDSGILIERNGKLLWHEQWQHSINFSMIYLRNSHMLVTDRLAVSGPCTMGLGICGIDMNNGKYLWKHWCEDAYEEGMALRAGRENVKKDIRLIGFGGGFVTGDYLLTNNFKIHLRTGNYERLEDKYEKESTSITENLIRPVSVIHDTVNYRGSIKNFDLPSDSSEKWGEKFSWYQTLICEAKEQKLLEQIKIYDIVDFFDDSLLIVGKEMKLRKDAIWLLKTKKV